MEMKGPQSIGEKQLQYIQLMASVLTSTQLFKDIGTVEGTDGRIKMYAMPNAVYEDMLINNSINPEEFAYTIDIPYELTISSKAELTENAVKSALSLIHAYVKGGRTAYEKK